MKETEKEENVLTKKSTEFEKLIEKHLIKGWGKRQLLKLGIAIAPVLAVTQEQIDSTVAVIIAGALMLIEICFSKLNANKLKNEK